MSVARGRRARRGTAAAVCIAAGLLGGTAAPGQAQVTFSGPTTVPIGPDPVSSIVAGDLNHDAIQDLVVGALTGGYVSVLMSRGAGAFSAPVYYAAGGAFVTSGAVGDLNGDGRLDVVASLYFPASAFTSDYNAVALWLGDGAGGLLEAHYFKTGQLPVSVAVGDFNGDGKQDLVTANNGPLNGVSVLLGDGAGGFPQRTDYRAGPDPYVAAVGQFNADGSQDLVVANKDAGRASLLFGDGAGAFSGEVAVPSGAGGSSDFVAVGDFDADDKQDLAVTNRPANVVSIMLGDGAGGFSAPADAAVGGAPGKFAIGDLSGDGRQDLAVSVFAEDRVAVLLGNGTGGFAAPVSFATGDEPAALAITDLDGDAKRDLAVANYKSADVSILLNTTPTPTPATPAQPSTTPPAQPSATAPPRPAPPSRSAFVTIPDQRLKVSSRRGSVRVAVACRLPAARTCRGTVQIRSTGRPPFGGGPRRAVTLGSGRLVIRGGRKAHVELRLGSTGRRVVRRLRALRVRVRVVPAASNPGRVVTRPLTLRR